MGEDDVQEEVETIRYFATFVDPEENITAVEDDPDDDKFLEAAVAGNVSHLVSGDHHLLELDSFRGIDIVTPECFTNSSNLSSPLGQRESPHPQAVMEWR